MSDWLEVPDYVIEEVGKVFSSFATTGTSSTLMSDLPPDLVQALIDYLGEDLGCDHAVNICTCVQAGVVAALKLAQIGKRYCPGCLGDGVLWEADESDEEPRPPTCDQCGGSGVVETTKPRPAEKSL